MSEPPAPRPGQALTLHLEVRFHDGFVALSTFGGEPIRCRIGDGTLAPGLEAALTGVVVGRVEILLAGGSDLFGDYDPDRIHWVDLPPPEPGPGLDPGPDPGGCLAQGQLVAFATPGGHETGGLILEVEGGRARVDFNHPFAGRSLTLKVQILALD
jgi:FKBP-type peptidyl-prolyl cis-trans isomerase 2